MAPTAIIDSDHVTIAGLVKKLTVDCGADPVQRAIKLYYYTRDAIRYDPYVPFHLPEHYRASNVLRDQRGYCVSKATLLCALARAAGIPARIGFANVKNHLATRQLIEHLGSDLFVYHGFTDLYLQGKWVKATPAFNRELCRHFGVAPLDFDGTVDAVMQAYNSQQMPFMEYIEYIGTYSDVPIQIILREWKNAYGEERVNGWIDKLANTPEGSRPDFSSEEII
ncbi:MAG: transglutaminase domain-containing protein [Desulfobacterales bacterium]|nr:transglutaminase domain-containing protein [Desulfobacterales bacterium]